MDMQATLIAEITAEEVRQEVVLHEPQRVQVLSDIDLAYVGGGAGSISGY